MADTQYPFDPNGTLVSNLISNEAHVVVPPTKITDASVIIARAAPFFSDGPDAIKVYAGTTTNRTLLTRGVHYKLVYKHLRLSLALGRDIFGGILFIDRSTNTNILLDYRTIGGNFVVNDAAVLESFSRSVRNVEYFNFEKAAGVPAGWAVDEHPVNGESTVGYEEMVDGIKEVAAAINSRNSGATSDNAALEAHLESNTAHNKSQVGLGNLQNYPVAASGDYPAGRIDAYATAAGVKTYVSSVLPTTQISVLEEEFDQLNQVTQALVVQADGNEVLVGQLAGAISDAIDDIEDLQTHAGVVDDAILALQNEQQSQGDDILNVSQQLTVTEAKASKALTQIEGLDTVGTFTNGTHRLTLRPQRRKTITMTGSGGNGGELVTDALDYVPVNDRNKIVGRVELYRLTDALSGASLVTPVLVATAIGGASGQYSITGRDGLGGIAGTNTVDEVEVNGAVTTNAGVVGEDGESSQTIATVGGNGHTVDGNVYGKGQDGTAGAGAGGSGMQSTFSIVNNRTFDIQYSLVIFYSQVTIANNQRAAVKVTDALL